MNVPARIAAAHQAGRPALDEAAAKEVLAAFGIAVPRSTVVGGADAAIAACRDLTPPFVVKVMSAEILHKSDVGGVAVGRETADAVGDAIAAMAAADGVSGHAVDGYLIEEMAPAGQEVVVGGVCDPQFGPMIMVGLGGIFVEILADVAFRLCPITKADALEMLDELQGAALLAGARGRASVSIDALVDVMLKVGGADGLLLALVDEVSEVDLNPVIVSETGAVAVDARLVLADPDSAPARTDVTSRDPAKVVAEFSHLFNPRTVAVVGASSSGSNMANFQIRRLKDFGYDGTIYPIHPSASEIEELPAYASLAETPEPIDYACVVVAAARVPEVLSLAGGRVRFAQVLSSGFAEVPQGTDLERDLVEAAKAGGCRLIGPNCLGVYSPRGRMTFTQRASDIPGPVALVSQSGGLATDVVTRGMVRGVRFSNVVTLGNSADVDPSDMLEFLLADDDTEVIGMYLEDVKDGRRFFRLLEAGGTAKPVVLLPGGRTQQGQRAAASHTGALAGDERVWTALSQQTGCAIVETLEEFIDVLLAFQVLKPRPDRPTERVVLFGNGGGTSVLATDHFARQNLDISRFTDATRAALEALELSPGTSINNPIDMPVNSLNRNKGRVAERILEEVYASARPDAIVMHLNLSAFAGRAAPEVLDNLIAAALRAQEKFPGQAHFLLVLRSDGNVETDAFKRQTQNSALAAGIPVYDEINVAALPLAAVARHERFRRDRGGD